MRTKNFYTIVLTEYELDILKRLLKNASFSELDAPVILEHIQKMLKVLEAI